MIFYYITDRRQFPGTESQQRMRLLEKIAEAARAGVDFIQLREKDLPARELALLANEAMRRIRQQRGSRRTRLLVNSRVDVAIAAGAEGVHLRADDMAASDTRVIFSKAGVHAPVIGVSCHSRAEVRLAESHGADFAAFGPVFEKSGAAGQSLAALREACGQVPARSIEAAMPAGQMPVLALGGVTAENATACMQAGAAGIAGIRLFQENDIAQAVEKITRHHRDTGPRNN
jgi:thiamine-phosphate pyrophosphorylase